MAELTYELGVVRINQSRYSSKPLYCSHLAFMMYKLGFSELSPVSNIKDIIWTRYDTELFACVVNRSLPGKYERVGDIMIEGLMTFDFPQKYAVK